MAETSVGDPQRAPAGVTAEIVALEQQRAKAADGCLEDQAGALNPSAHDDQIEAGARGLLGFAENHRHAATPGRRRNRIWSWTNS